MEDCIFCKIASGEINTDLIYEDEDVVAFRDINPQAPFHVLLIPRIHISSIKEEIKNKSLIGKMFLAGNQIAKKNGIEDFRYIINTGEQAGQTVFHLHLHLLGGRVMNWPPG